MGQRGAIYVRGSALKDLVPNPGFRAVISYLQRLIKG